MKNSALEDIKKYAIARLNEEYGFVGVADGDDAAFINSADENGNGISIKIEAKSK